jgi:transcriptional regulator with XRE-family HTH domain
MDLNPVLTPVRDIGEFIREQRTSAQISIRALAAKAGVSNPYLSQVERGLRRPSAEILAQIAHALSISVESLLFKAGILETADAPEVVCAIRADGVLTERHKAALVDIYAAFRKEALGAAALAEGAPFPSAPPVGDSIDPVSSTTPGGPSGSLSIDDTAQAPRASAGTEGERHAWSP